jgi:hypothetical protein
MKSRKIRVLAALFLGGLASGCSGTVVNLRNPQTGATVSCESGGMTIASQQVKQALITECVDGYTKQGYEIVANSR